METAEDFMTAVFALDAFDNKYDLTELEILLTCPRCTPVHDEVEDED